jgi:hypothetical protein
MYFADKFNKEIQILARHQATGGETNLGNFDSGAFYKLAPVNPNNPNKVPFVKVIPLLMFNRISSDNPNDTSFENLCIICENKPSTKIRCWTE